MLPKTLILNASLELNLLLCYWKKDQNITITSVPIGG